jgi:hypothetical protein
MKDKEIDKIIAYYLTSTSEHTCKKMRVSRLHLNSMFSKWVEEKKYIPIQTLTISEIMDKYQISNSKALILKRRYEIKELKGNVYFGKVKEAIYSNEQEMLIPEYNFNGLSESEKIIYKTL